MDFILFCLMSRSLVAAEKLQNFAKSDFGRGRAWHIRFHLPLAEINTLTNATISFPEGTGNNTLMKYEKSGKMRTYALGEKMCPRRLKCRRLFKIGKAVTAYALVFSDILIYILPITRATVSVGGNGL